MGKFCGTQCGIWGLRRYGASTFKQLLSTRLGPLRRAGLHLLNVLIVLSKVQSPRIAATKCSQKSLHYHQDKSFEFIDLFGEPFRLVKALPSIISCNPSRLLRR